MPVKHHNDPTLIRDLLATPATWAVVGLANHPQRTAYGIARFLQEPLGHRIIPIHPDAKPVHGEQGYARLADVPDGTTVDVVDYFVRSEKVGVLVDEAIQEAPRLDIRALWLQLGVVDEDAARRAQDAGLAVVMDTSPKIEYPRLRP